MMTQETLEEHMAACESAYEVMIEENGLLKSEGALSDDFLERKRAALARLDAALEGLRGLGERGGNLSAATRAAAKKTQQIVLKALLLDRENEQWLLKVSAPKRRDVPQARPTLDQIEKLYRKHGAAPKEES
jgi:fructose-specific phosphotransferase system component IIB